MTFIESFRQYVSEHKKYIDSKNKAKNTVVINAFAGPGAGKTVSALILAAELAKKGYTAEYVSEYAKELVYDNHLALLSGEPDLQLAVLQEQVHRIDRVYGTVDFIVCDSPIMLNPLYLATPNDEYNKLTYELFSEYNNFCYFVERDQKHFEQSGRIHNLEESIAKDNEIKNLLSLFKIYFGIYNHNTITTVLDNILKYENRINKKIAENEQQKRESESGTGSASAEQVGSKQTVNNNIANYTAQAHKLSKLAKDTAVKVVSSGKELYNFLKLMSRFKDFSTSNLLLIYGQNPNATQLKTFDEWKEEGKNLKKGVSATKIRKKADNGNNEFTVVNLFDVSQLRSDDSPEAQKQTEAPDRQQMKRLFRLMTAGFAPRAKIAGESDRAEVSLDYLHGEDAVYSPEDKVIYVRENLPTAVQLNLICRETLLSYVAGRDKSYSRDKYIIECSCAALVVCERHDIDSSYFFSELDEFCTAFPKDDTKKIWQLIDNIKSKSNTVSEVIEKNSRSMEQQIQEPA